MKSKVMSLYRWIRRVSAMPQLRVVFLAALTAATIGPGGSGPGMLQRVASWPGFTRGPVSAIDVSGHYGFVAIGEGGLLVLDLADPAKPVRVGSYLPPGRTEHVQIVGTRAYLGTLVHHGGGCEQESWRSRVLILDISDPVHPSLLGSHNTSLQMRNLFVDGNLAYMYETGPETSDFRIIDVSDPTRLATLSVNRGFGGEQVWAIGDRAYIGMWSSLRILDVSQPSSPIELTNVDQEVRSMDGVSNRLYVLRGDGGSGGLTIYDLGSGVVPRLLGTLPLTNSAVSVHVSGDRAYVATAQDGLVVIDVSNPGKPVRLGSCDTPGCAESVKTFGNHALVADSYGVEVVDVTDPLHPVPLSGYDTGLTTRGVRVSADRAYVMSADWERVNGSEARSRLEILDINNPTQPVLLGVYAVPSFIGALDLTNDLAYLVSASGDGPSLEIVDLSYPAAPLRLSRTLLSAGGDFSRLGISISGKYAYVAAAGGGVQIFDVSTPAKPVRLNDIANSHDAYAVQVSGDRAYLGSDSALEVVNVANPKVPLLAGTLLFEQGGNGGARLQVCDGHAYSGVGWNGFTITDVRNSTNLVLAGGYDTLGQVQDLCIVDCRAFVAEGWEGLTVFDVSAPAHPMPIGCFATCGQAYGIQVSGNYAFVAEGGSGLSIVSLPPGPVTVVQDPVSVSAALGETTTLSVGAYGRGRLSYQWYAGESGDVSHPFAGATEPSFSTPMLTQTAAYWVRVSSSSGTADSRTAWVDPVLPVAVELLSMWPGHRRGPAVSVQVAGNLAYVAAGGLQIWDLANEASPRLVGSHDAIGWNVNSLTLSRNLAFLPCNERGLLVIDVSRPETPALLGSFTITNGYMGQVAVLGSVACVAGDLFRILDISDPTQPRLLAMVEASGRGVAVQGQYAYLVSDSGYLGIFDIIDPTRPLRVANARISSASPNAVRVAGSYAYVAERLRCDGPNRFPGGLAVVDISNPSQSHRVGSFQVSTNGDAIDLDVNGTHAFVEDAGLQIIDISDPAKPACVGALSTNGYAQTVLVSGKRAYRAVYETGLQLVDIAALAKPKLVQIIETAGYVEDVVSVGHHALVADGSGGLTILDLSDPRQPASLGAYRTNGYARRVVANSPLAYFLGDAFHILDLSDPVYPSCIGALNLDSWGEWLSVSGGNAYLCGDDLTAIDVRNPTEPKVLSVNSVAGISSTSGMAVNPPYFFLAQGWGGMQTIDLSLPAEPRRPGGYFSDAPIGDVAIRSNVACITLGIEMPALEVIDIREFWRPTRVASVSLPIANNVAFMGNYACVTGEGLQVFDLADPQRPIRVGAHKLGCGTRRLHIADDLVYVAAGDYGLAIYRLTPQLRLDPPVIDRNGMRLSWLGGPGIRLQRATSLANPIWQDVPNSEGVSSLRFPVTNTTAFFRLVRL